MRNCDGCEVCCSGYLIGNTRGSWFGNLKPCKYLVNGCQIYKDRPSQCSDYECAWTQGLLPEWMKPSEIGLVVSVEIDRDGRQFLHVMYKDEFSEASKEEINKFVQANQTYFVASKVIPIKEIK